MLFSLALSKVTSSFQFPLQKYPYVLEELTSLEPAGREYISCQNGRLGLCSVTDIISVRYNMISFGLVTQTDF